MLDERIVALARKSAAVQIEDRQLPIRARVNQLKAQLHGQGRLYLELVSFFAAEARGQSEIIWRNLHRAHGTFGSPVTNTLATDLVQEFREQFGDAVENLARVFEEDMVRAPRGVSLEVANSRDLELARHEMEIEHYVTGLTAAKSEKSAVQPVVYNFYGAVGAFQSGAGASANVVQIIGAVQRDALEHALHQVRETIASAKELENRDKQELIEITDDAAAEIKKETPNTRRLALILQNLAAAVQGIASGAAAYEVLRTAAAAIGIPI